MKNKYIDTIILAAGLSSRSEKYKMTLPLGDKTIIEKTVESMLQVCDRVILVTGNKSEIINSIFASNPKVKCVFNPNFELGMFSSVQTGVQEVNGSHFFLIPGDQPLIRKTTLEAMLKVDANIVSPRFNNKKGHPVLFKHEMKKGILEMPDTGILRDFIHKIGCTIVDVDDPGIHMDVDTEDDYTKILDYFDKYNEVQNERKNQ